MAHRYRDDAKAPIGVLIMALALVLAAAAGAGLGFILPDGSEKQASGTVQAGVSSESE